MVRVGEASGKLEAVLRAIVEDRDGRIWVGTEFEGLVRSGLARLNDAERDSNSLDSRFDLAYSAAHALCLAALRHVLVLDVPTERVGPQHVL